MYLCVGSGKGGLVVGYNSVVHSGDIPRARAQAKARNMECVEERIDLRGWQDMGRDSCLECLDRVPQHACVPLFVQLDIQQALGWGDFSDFGLQHEGGEVPASTTNRV